MITITKSYLSQLDETLKNGENYPTKANEAVAQLKIYDGRRGELRFEDDADEYFNKLVEKYSDKVFQYKDERPAE